MQSDEQSQGEIYEAACCIPCLHRRERHANTFARARAKGIPHERAALAQVRSITGVCD